MIDLLSRLRACAQGYKHQDYKHVVDKAMLYRQIVTTQHQDKLVVSYKPSETHEQREQRTEIYTSKTPEVVNQIASQFDFVAGAARNSDSISYTNDTPPTIAYKNRLNALVSRFYGKTTLQQYLEKEQKHFSFIDPNAWLVLTPNFNDLGELTAIPTNIPAHCAVDFKNYGGITEYLIIEQAEKIGDNTACIFIGLAAGLQITLISETPNYQYPAQDYTIEMIGDKKFRIYQYPNSSTETTAIRYGYTPDDATNGRTFIGILDPVCEGFKDLINRKSEYDLSLNLHVFLKKYQIVDACDYRDSDQVHIRCNGGRLTNSNTPCPKCKGTGYKQHTTSQDVINVKRAGDDETQIPLAEMVYYASMPFDIVTHQAERVDKIAKELPKYIFGVDLETRQTGAKTATEIDNYYNSLYLVLAAYADKISENYIFTVTAMAQLMGEQVTQGLIVNHRYPRTFKMETVAELLTMLSDAKASGAPNAILWDITLRILEIQNKDNPAQIEKAKLIHRYQPFQHLSENERLVALAALPTDNYYSILHNYSDVIFRRIFQLYPAFLTFPQTEQDRIVLETVNALKPEIKEPNPTLELPTPPTA
jgi:hypothetical protein